MQYEQTSGISYTDTVLVITSRLYHSKTKGANFDDKRSTISDMPDLVTSALTSTVATLNSKQEENTYSNVIYCTPLLGRLMQCNI